MMKKTIQILSAIILCLYLTQCEGPYVATYTLANDTDDIVYYVVINRDLPDEFPYCAVKEELKTLAPYASVKLHFLPIYDKPRTDVVTFVIYKQSTLDNDRADALSSYSKSDWIVGYTYAELHDLLDFTVVYNGESVFDEAD